MPASTAPRRSVARMRGPLLLATLAAAVLSVFAAQPAPAEGAHESAAHTVDDRAAHYGLSYEHSELWATDAASAPESGGRILQSNNIPTWVTPTAMTVRVPDLMSVGDIITSVVAADVDPVFSTGGKLTYSLQSVVPAGGASLFSVDAATGRLLVAASMAGLWRAGALGSVSFAVTVRGQDGLLAAATPDTVVTVVMWPG
jgi:hypothetical protein